MSDMEKRIKHTFHSATMGLEPNAEVKEKIFSRLDHGLGSHFLLIRIPIAVSFFTTIIAIPISVY
jgi:hypothetical protein